MQTRVVTHPPNRPFPVDAVDHAEPVADQFLSAFLPRANVFFDGGADGIGGAMAANRVTTIRRGTSPAHAANALSLTTGFHGAR